MKGKKEGQKVNKRKIGKPRPLEKNIMEKKSSILGKSEKKKEGGSSENALAMNSLAA